MALGDEDGLEEEQRLFYVAITRARDTLSIYTPGRLPTDWSSYRARQVHAKTSRFITEQAAALLNTHEQSNDIQPAAAVASIGRVEIPVLEHLFK
jgi:DNA helicase-2/ATP-dependent DNA helicase PcrA